MKRVRRHIGAAIEAGKDPAELTDEVVRTFELTPVEAALAETMAQHHGSAEPAKTEHERS